MAFLVVAACGGRQESSGNGDELAATPAPVEPITYDDEDIEIIEVDRIEVPQPASKTSEAETSVPAAAPSKSKDVKKQGGFPAVQPLSKLTGRYDEVFNDSNYVQYAFAERLGIDPITSLYEAYNTSRPLVKIGSCDSYHLDNLTHSMPYLVPEAASLLKEIGDDFGEMVRKNGGDPAYNKIIVTSVLRSPYTVKKLRRVNRNAVDSSTHMFGTTFDIAWNNFHYPDSTKSVNAGVLKGLLAEVLYKKRSEGKCLVKYEKKTPCFHITVCK